MNQPEFGESQLQAVVNNAILRAIYGNHLHRWPIPLIPTLLDEHGLGWDTGFFFNHLHLHPLQDNHGCNFFIQYKLSNEYSNNKSRFYKYWNASYFGFRIPYRRDGKYDFNQFKRLKKISRNGYPVFYVTNSITRTAELQTLWRNNALLNQTPFLDVSLIKGKHLNVSFSNTSKHFLLHSSPEENPKMFWEKVQRFLSEQTFSHLGEGNSKLFELLKSLLYSEDIGSEVDSEYRGINELPEIFRAPFKFLFLRSVFFRIFGLSLQRYAHN